MGTYREAFVSIDFDGGRTDFVEIYHQSAWRHHTYRLLCAAERLTWGLQRILTPLDERWHARGCAGDCVTGEVSRRPRLADGSFAEIVTTVETYCGHVPLSARVDLWLLDFHNRDRVVVGREDQAARPG